MKADKLRRSSGLGRLRNTTVRWLVLAGSFDCPERKPWLVWYSAGGNKILQILEGESDGGRL